MGSNREAFFALLRAGLWEQGVRLLPYEPLDFDAIYEIADAQSVVGLLAAGLEHVEDRKVTKPEALKFLKRVFSLEGKNASVCAFIEDLMGRLWEAGIYALLVKGQGLAQCYKRPQWRSVGDVDLLLDSDNYLKAKELLLPLAQAVKDEDIDKKHIGITIDSWLVELHGTLHNGLSSRITRVVDRIQEETIRGGQVRMWRNGETNVPLPCIDNDIIFVFTHLLQHFFQGGIRLRQVCDWSRLLWTYRGSIDVELMRSRISEMRLMSEWEVFATLAVEHLGCPVEAMPLYRDSKAIHRRSERALRLILEAKTDDEYKKNAPVLKRKLITIWRTMKDTLTFVRIFPIDAFRFLGYFFVVGFQRTRHTTTL